MAKIETSAKQGRKPGVRQYACATPKEKCIGNFRSECNQKVHSDEGSAARCTIKYLTSIGYTRISSREWRLPEGGILVLDKKSVRAYPGKYDGLLKGILPRLPSPQVVA